MLGLRPQSVRTDPKLVSPAQKEGKQTKKTKRTKTTSTTLQTCQKSEQAFKKTPSYCSPSISTKNEGERPPRACNFHLHRGLNHFLLVPAIVLAGQPSVTPRCGASQHKLQSQRVHITCETTKVQASVHHGFGCLVPQSSEYA